jgi:hypothetical protein
MAVNTNSNLVADPNASPTVPNPAGKQYGRVRIAQDAFEVVAADIDADGDTVRLCTLPANARITSIKLANDDLDGASNVAFNVGIYETPSGAGAPTIIQDEDYFASAVTMQAAARLTEVFDEAAAAANVADIGKKLYEMAGDTDAVHDATYDIVLTQTAAASSAQAGTIAFQIEFIVD